MGIPCWVMGGNWDFIIDKYKVETVIVSFQMNGDEKKREIQQLCLRKGLDTKNYPYAAGFSMPDWGAYFLEFLQSAVNFSNIRCQILKS